MKYNRTYTFLYKFKKLIILYKLLSVIGVYHVNMNLHCKYREQH